MKKFYEEIALEVLKFSLEEIRLDFVSMSENAKDDVEDDIFPGFQ